jgi:hypothetical protein
MMDPSLDVRGKMRVWKKALDSSLADIIQERIGEDMELLIRTTHSLEWDLLISMKLKDLRRKDKDIDRKLTALVYYNDDIDEQERERRFKTLNRKMSNGEIDRCNALTLAPSQESWHVLLDDEPGYTDEIWESLAQKIQTHGWNAIGGIPQKYAERFRVETPRYWAQRREDWNQRLAQRLTEFKEKNEKYGKFTAEKLKDMIAFQKRWIASQERFLLERIDQRKLETGRKEADLLSKIRKLEKEYPGQLTKEGAALYAEQRTLPEVDERVIRQSTKENAEKIKDMKWTLQFYFQCMVWIGHAQADLRKIQEEARKEWKDIEIKQEKECKWLFSKDTTEKVQNISFADLLENHLTGISPGIALL